MYENFKELEDGSKELGESAEIEGGMPTPAHRLKAGLVQKASVMNRTAEFWMVSRIASWEGGTLFHHVFS